jgi:hypothetical protein
MRIAELFDFGLQSAECGINQANADYMKQIKLWL